MTIFDKNIYPYITPINHGYETCEHCRAELWVHSNDFTLEELIALISEENWPKHQVFNKKRSVSPFKGVYSITSDDHVKSSDLRAHLDWLCDLLEQSKGLKSVQENINSRAQISCFWWSKYGDGAPTLWPKQLKRLANLDMEFSISYSHYDD